MTISIVLYAEHIERTLFCMNSIQLHTRLPYELIVINELSDDKCALQAYQAIPNVRVLKWPNPLSVMEGFKIAASMTAGDFIVYMYDYIAVTAHWDEDFISAFHHNHRLAMLSPILSTELAAAVHEGQINPLKELYAYARGIRLTRSRGNVSANVMDRPIFCVNKKVFQHSEAPGYETVILQDCMVINTTSITEQLTLNMEQEHSDTDFRVSVSLCMIVKNEENTLSRCLSSVHDLVDEIIIVDTGSSDRTKDVAGQFTDKIYDFEWVNDFAKARNYAFSLATKDYVMWLDADDVIRAEDQLLFKDTLMEVTPDIDYISMPYLLSFNEQGQVLSRNIRNRIVKRSQQFSWHGKIHEYLEVSGLKMESSAAVTHLREHKDTMRNLHMYEKRERQGEVLTSRDLFYYGNELYDHKRWEQAIERYEQFLEREDGWIEDQIAACGRLSDGYYELGRIKDAKLKLLQSFMYAAPRAENCCRMGFLHMQEEDYAGAMVWYEQALHIPDFIKSEGIVIHSYRTWLPHLQLCVCYDRLNMVEKAYEHNEAAAQYEPNHPSIVANREYFHRFRAEAVN